MKQSQKIVIRGGQVITPEDERRADILIENGLIAEIGDLGAIAGAEEIQAAGMNVTPGLFDLQVNGGPQCDFWGPLKKSDVAAFSKSLALAGVTSFLPTLITGDIDALRQNIDFLKTAKGDEFWSQMPGIHLEGPCLSPQRPGVHPPQHLQPLTAAVLEKLADPTVRLMTLAPELDPSGECIKQLQKQGVTVALGHSDATFEEAQSAFSRGVAMMTHTFNALPPLHHRKPGAVGAALIDDRVFCCMICDGLHLDPAAATLIFKTKGVDRTILVTDVAHIGTDAGGLVGSSILLDKAVRNVVEWGICSFREAIVMASYNPAVAMGLDDRIGTIAVGRPADIVLWNRLTLAVEQTLVGGCPVK